MFRARLSLQSSSNKVQIKFNCGSNMVQTPPRHQTLPPLENGDRLTRAEFERREAAMPEGSKAQLIEGIVYMSAALRFRSHGKPHSHLNSWLTTYQIFTPGVEIGDAATVRMDESNQPQPDLVMLIDPLAGGQARFSEDDYIEGAPELLAEISASTVSIDIGAKKRAYERNGVREYLVWRVLDQALDWFCLENGKYVELRPDSQGMIKSRTFPGLWLDRSALLSGNMQQVLAVLQSGLATAAHPEFGQSLQARLD
jgi:Putative restriction endonuclease